MADSTALTHLLPVYGRALERERASDVIRRLCAECDVPRSQTESDFWRFVDELVRLKLLIPSTRTKPTLRRLTVSVSRLH